MKHPTKTTLLCLLFAVVTFSVSAQQWPKVTQGMLPGTRWWWLGNAVDTANISYSLQSFAQAGLGNVEVTPIYGVQGNDANEIPFLSPRWMEMLRFTESVGKKVGISVDINEGTGWPFGGPMIGIEEAATKAFFQEYSLSKGQKLTETIMPKDAKQRDVAKLSRLMAFNGNQHLDLTDKVLNGQLDWKAPKGNWKLIALFVGKNFQQVKRAAPGGEGLVMDHFSATSVKKYLETFTKAFNSTGTPYPQTFFNDSYEVYNADWTPKLLDEFYQRRHYKLENYFPEFLGIIKNDTSIRVIADYRETLSDMLLENFTNQWTSWAHSHGSLTRNQAHGSPGNLIDLYGAVDIPECESFGLSEFNISGLRTDTFSHRNLSDLSMLKYASSAAHITGKPYTSSETLTWLTEHFRTSLSQCKPDIDLMLVSGINQMRFHGTPYSPKEAAWPGWLFYASVNMSPTNSIWRDCPSFFKYIARCQSFLQAGTPDNDYLVYLPIYDIWNDVRKVRKDADVNTDYESWNSLDSHYIAFEIADMKHYAPNFIKAIHTIYEKGYDVDYISDRFIRSLTFKDGMLKTEGGTSYKALIIPAVRLMPEDVLAHLIELAKQGATIAFMEKYPEDVPGLGNLQARRTEFSKIHAQLPSISFTTTNIIPLMNGKIITGNDYADVLSHCGGACEEMKTRFGLSSIRRHDNNGYIYFISSLQNKGVDDWISLGVKATSALLYNPMNGFVGSAAIRNKDGKTQVRLQLLSGESVILRTYANDETNAEKWPYIKELPNILTINKGWSISFPESEPKINGQFFTDTLTDWTKLPVADASRNMGTGLYSTTFDLPQTDADDWILDLGDVRESARVRINGQDVATAWAVPFRLLVNKYLKKGKNTLEIEVTNLPANRIADYDRKGINWRIFKEINMVNIDYKKSDYSRWPTAPSGLISNVKLIPVSLLKFF